jgi:hypothetical protein
MPLVSCTTPTPSRMEKVLCVYRECYEIMATAENRLQSAERRSVPSQSLDPERTVVQISPRQTTMALATIAAILAALSIGQHLYPGNDVPIDRINLDSEISIPTWFQSTLLLLAGALTALIAVIRSRASPSYVRHWIVAAVALILMSGDEMLALHEMLIDPMRALLDVGGGLIYFAWIVPGAVVAVAFAATYLRFLAHLPERIRKLFVTAGVLYLMGVLGMEALDGAYASSQGSDTLGYMLLTDLEEVFEMAGLLVLVYALLSYLSILEVSFRSATVAIDLRSSRQ